jgi:hypothetical protein
MGIVVWAVRKGQNEGGESHSWHGVKTGIEAVQLRQVRQWRSGNVKQLCGACLGHCDC